MESQHQNFENSQDESTTVESVHHIDIRQKLFSFCENQTFSDICIVTSDDERFHAHKCVLSASSDYFMAMIGGDMKEARESEIKIHEVNGEIFRPILAFMYTGKIELQNKTVEDVLRAAIFFQVKSLIIECCSFMEEEFDARNCLGIAIFAEQQGLMELYQNAFGFACEQFYAVWKEKEFLEINEDQLDSLISSKLCVLSEEIVFLSIIRWIEHDQTNRGKYAYNLFSKVRYQFLSTNFIKHHRSKLQMYQSKCEELMCAWLEWRLFPENIPTKLVLLSNGLKQVYDPESDSWTCEEISLIPEDFKKALKVNNKLVFSDGSESLTCLDLYTNEKTKLPPLEDDHLNCELAVLNDELYAVGGSPEINFEPKLSTRFVDKFDFSLGNWQPIAPMITRFTHLQVAVGGGLMYVTGDEGVMNCFNPDTNEWTLKDFIHRDIRDFGFTIVNNKLYVVGGVINGVELNSLYSHDLLSERWERETNMDQRLSRASYTSWNNQLICFGGYDYVGDFSNVVLKYNPATEIWVYLADPKCFGFYHSPVILSL